MPDYHLGAQVTNKSHVLGGVKQTQCDTLSRSAQLEVSPFSLDQYLVETLAQG